MGIKQLLNYYQKKPSRQVVNTTFYSIKREYSALDFIPEENILKTNAERESNLRVYYISSVVKKWVAIIILGLFVGMLGAIQSIAVEEMFIFKYTYLSSSLRINSLFFSFLLMMWTVFPILLCSLLVIIEPTLKGSGVASIIAYLNGIKIKRFHKLRTLLLQYLSIFLISAANMPGGREELFIRVGALSGAAITTFKIPWSNWRPFLSMSDAVNRRALVAAGTAAGVAVSFGTPIAIHPLVLAYGIITSPASTITNSKGLGVVYVAQLRNMGILEGLASGQDANIQIKCAVIFCLEEGVTFWSPELTFLMFLCTICSNFVLHLSYTIYSKGGDYSFDLTYYLFFSHVNHIKLTYRFIEVLIFFLMGVIGGLLGSLWNEVHIQLHKYRKKYIRTQIIQLLEVFFLGLIISICGISAFHIFGAECTKEFGIDSRLSRSKQMKIYCTQENQFESVGIFLFQDLRHAITSIFMAHEELVSTSVILFGAAFYFIFSELQFGTHLPCGVLVPHLVCGASWGYLIGVWYSKLTEENLIVAKYAFLGAVAQGSGVARLSLSLGIIMIESCGRQTYTIPIFIIVVTAKWFGGIFSRPIYRTEAYLEGYPFMRATDLPLTIPYSARSIMAAPMVTLPRRINVQGLIDVLRTGYHTFPVLQNKKVIGAVTKYQIAIVLKTKTFNLFDSPDEIQVAFKAFQEFQGESFTELKKVMHSEMSDEDLGKIVDLTNIMNTSPYLINREMSLRKIYQMFLALALPYVIVVDDSLDAIGIITRKDVASFRKLSQFFLMRTELVPIK